MDAFVADRSILGGYMQEDRRLLPAALSRQEYVVCGKKGSALAVRAGEVIDNRLQDGAIDALKNKWGN